MADKDMSEGFRTFGADFGKTAGDYATHRAGFPPSFFARAAELGIGVGGQSLLDLGTGTGTLARGFALAGARVTGLDVAAAMMEQAAALDHKAGVSVTYVEAPANQTGLPGNSFDIVTAGQCWHWFPAEETFAEVRRLLKPEGRLVICHFDWLPLPGNVVEATERLILEVNPTWPGAGGTGVYPRWLSDAARFGMTDIRSETFDHPQVYSHEAWRGRIRASAGISASLTPEAVEAFDRSHAAMLARDFPDDPLIIPHRIFIMTCRAG